MADFDAIANAIAARFTAANVTPPTNETDIRESTAALPQAIRLEPTVLVFPPEPGGIELSYMGGTLSGIATFPVRFYLWRIRDNARNAALVNKWLGSLYPQLIGQVHLGLSSYVTHAVIRDLGAARLTYANDEFEGIALTAEVHFWEALNAVA